MRNKPLIARMFMMLLLVLVMVGSFCYGFKDVSECYLFDNPLDGDECYHFFAVNKADSNLCAKMSIESNKDFCYFDFFMCGKISTSNQVIINSCYYNKAIFERDTSICEKITNDDGKKRQCYLDINNKVSIIRDPNEPLQSELTSVGKCDWMHSNGNEIECSQYELALGEEITYNGHTIELVDWQREDMTLSFDGVIKKWSEWGKYNEWGGCYWMACGTQAPRVIKDVRLSSKVGGSMMVQIELVVSNACENGMTDGREEGIDCGGPFCSSCNKIDVQEVNSVFPDVITTKTVNIETNLGDFKLELFTEKAPITTRNFIELAEKGFYDGTKFHRVITNFMIQGGDPFSKEDSKKSLWGTGGPGYEIKDEFHPELSNVRGTIAMANHGPDTGGSQFFINLVNNTHLDYNKNPTQSKHPVFGKVTNGMDVVDRISNVETEGDKPVRDVVINKITVEGKLKEEKIMVEPSPGHLQSSGQEDTPPITNHNSRSNKYLLIGLIVFVFLLVGVYLFRTFRKKPRRKRKKKIESEEKPSVYRDVKVAISVSNFKLQYKDKSIIDNVSFEVEKGDMVCLLGGSGTGKSSIIEALVGRKKPTRGDVRIFGEDISKDKEIFNHVGFVPQHPELYMNQSVEKNLLSSATKWGVKGSKEKTEKILSRIGLSHRKELKASKLSGGQLKLLSLGMELLRNPELLILDEPTTGLDPNTRNNIITILSHISSQLHKTILFSTHFMDDAEECDEVIIISGSKIVARGAPSKLEKRLPGGGKIVKIVLDYVTDDLLERIKVIDGVQKVIREGRGLRIITDEPNAVQMGHKIDEFGGIVNETKIDRATMMDVFVYHTGKELKE